MRRAVIGNGVRAACLLWAWALAAPASAETTGDARDVRNTSGLAVAIGIGGSNGWAGGQVDYYVEWGHPRLRLGSFLGLGWAGGRKSDEPKDKLGVALGAFGSFGGRTHRLYFDAHAMTYGSLRSYWGAFERNYWAVVGCAGYEVVTRRGFLMRLAGGVGSAILRGSLFEPLDRLVVDFQFSLGWKLW